METANQLQVSWGYALPWYGPFQGFDEDPWISKLKFLKEHGLRTTGISLNELLKMNEEQLSRIGDYLAEHDLSLTPRIGFDYLHADSDTIKQQAEAIERSMRKLLPLIRGMITTSAMNAGHRFDRSMPLEQKMDHIAQAVEPLAKICAELGAPLAIENHGDYYVSEIVDLCKRVPHLYLYLDTGNTYLLGERPLPAFEIGAPYTIGSHFKDHHVQPRPEARPLHFEVAPSALGEGDVPLRACYELLMKHAPRMGPLVMEIEMICPDDMDPKDCLDRSLKFVRSLDSNA